MNADDKLLIFLHIQKTAGTTLWFVFHQQYGGGKYVRVQDPDYSRNIEDFAKLAERDTGKLRLLGGHVPFGVHTYTSRPYRYFTMLRDPQERAISNFYHVLRQPRNQQHEEFTRERLALEDGLRRLPRNAQTLVLAGCDPNTTEATPEHLALAKHNLQHEMRVVGLTERFDESLLLYAAVFGWSLPFYVKKNIGHNRPPHIDDSIRQLAGELNALDVELYRFGTALFQEQLARTGVRGKLWQFRVLLPLWRLTAQVKR